MVRVVEVVGAERARREQRHGFVVEALVGRREGHVRPVVNGAGVDEAVGGDVRDRREEVVHEARFVLVGRLLQDEAVVERARHCHVVHVQQVRAVREHGVDAERLQLGDVRHGRRRQEQLVAVDDLAVLRVDLLELLGDLVEAVAQLPVELSVRGVEQD